MIPICLPTNNRLDYFSQIIKYLKECERREEFMILTAEEPPSDILTPILEECSEWIEVERHINKNQKFCSRNIIEMISYAFNINEFVIIIEDDITVSKDFLNYMLWFKDNYKDSEYFAAIAYKHNSQEMPEDSWDKVIAIDGFAAWGWGLFADKWKNHIDFLNMTRTNIDAMPPWDVKLLRYLQLTKQKVIQPVLSRSNNIGRVGAHMDKVHTKEFFDQNIDSIYWHGSGKQDWKNCVEWHLDS